MLEPVQHTKALTPEQNDRIRELVTHAGKALGISHSMLHEIVEGRRGAGMRMLQALSKHTGRTVDDLLGVEVERTRDGQHEGDALGEHPLWSSVLSEFRASAERRQEKINEDVIREMAQASFSRTYSVLTVAGIRRVYDALMQLQEDDHE